MQTTSQDSQAILDQYHPVVTKILASLSELDCWFETFEHQPVRTSEEAAQVRTGYSLDQGAKALIVRVKLQSGEKKFVMLVLSGSAKFDRTLVQATLQGRDIRFATPDEVAQITQGVELGGVPPFGNLFNLEVYVDPNLLKHEKIIFNAGDKRFSVAMQTADYLRLVKPTVVTMVV